MISNEAYVRAQNYNQQISLAEQRYVEQPPFVVEAVPGGFIVSGVGGRQVARNVAQVARLLREWAPKPEPKPAGAAE